MAQAPPDDAGECQREIERAREFLSRFGTSGEVVGSAPDYVSQCEAMLAAHPIVISPIMGIFDAGREPRAFLQKQLVKSPPRLAESGRSAATARITESGTIRCDQSRHVTPSRRGALRV